MTMKKPMAAIALASLLAACVGSPTAGPANSPSPSPTSTASATAAPSAAPTSGPQASPSPSPVVAGDAIDWQSGQPLMQYDFEGLGGIHYNPYLDQISVIDAVDDNTSRRYQLRKFRPDGTYISTVSLAPADEEAPDAVDAMTFDPSGAPLFSYRNDGEFRLLKLLTATVQRAERYPLNAAAWAGPSALGAAGVDIRVALLNLDVKDRDDARRRGLVPTMTGGAISIGIAEEDEPPTALFQVADPFVPTRVMAFAPNGDLFLGGQTATGFGLKRIKPDQTIDDLGAVPARPEGMWPRPAGGVYFAWEINSSTPARLVAADPAGTRGAEQELRLANGGFLSEITGLTIDKQGRALVAGSGFDGSNQRVSGVFVFAARP